MSESLPLSRARLTETVQSVALVCRLTFAQTAAFSMAKQRHRLHRSSGGPVCFGRGSSSLLRSDLAPLCWFLLLWLSCSKGPASTGTRSVPPLNGRSSLVSGQELSLRFSGSDPKEISNMFSQSTSTHAPPQQTEQVREASASTRDSQRDG